MCVWGGGMGRVGGHERGVEMYEILEIKFIKFKVLLLVCVCFVVAEW